MSIFIAIKTTGPNPILSEVIAITLLGPGGDILLDALVKPLSVREWQDRATVKGIPLSAVSDAPTLTQLTPQIRKIIGRQDIVIYGKQEKGEFLQSVLPGLCDLHCCKRAWTNHIGHIRDSGEYRQFSLRVAAQAVYFKWPPESSCSAYAGALACRAVWLYLNNKQERRRIDSVTCDIENERLANYYLRITELRLQRQQKTQDAKHTQFFDHWWLKRYGIKKHWANFLSETDRENLLALTFFKKPMDIIRLEDEFEDIYTSKTHIPDHLKSIDCFPSMAWFRSQLKPCAAYIGRRRQYKLYDIGEKQKILTKHYSAFHSRDTSEESLFTKGELIEMGFKKTEIRKLPRVRLSANTNLYHSTNRGNN